MLLAFVYLGFYIAFNTVQVILRQVAGRPEETSILKKGSKVKVRNGIVSGDGFLQVVFTFRTPSSDDKGDVI